MTGEDDLLAENAKLKLTNKNMALFISNLIVALERLGKALSIESGTIFSTVDQIRTFQAQFQKESK